MVKLCSVIAIFCLANIASTRVVRDAPETPTTTQELFKNANELVTNFTNILTEHLGGKTPEELLALGQEKAKSIQDGFETLREQLSEQVNANTENINEKLKTLGENIQGLFKDVGKENPEFSNTLKSLQNNFLDTVKTIQTEVEKLREGFVEKMNEKEKAAAATK